MAGAVNAYVWVHHLTVTWKTHGLTLIKPESGRTVKYRGLLSFDLTFSWSIYHGMCVIE
jgi:hypothetical protein